MCKKMVGQPDIGKTHMERGREGKRGERKRKGGEREWEREKERF
jgi:hypothetical protein